ncbi:hypothetical protein ACFQ8E_09970 [Isoptericola sp. NPDC056573]|uniref:hypothetical protein n=1 Tax=Isoptericola sp. NPDC056573 TaxID=3345868 RepID=UPI0036A447FB
MSDDKPTTPGPEPDETQALPAPDETQALPAADETQALPAADATRALPAADETQAFAGSGDTRAFPVAGPDDPLSIFDRPERPAEPASTEHATTQAAGSAPATPSPGYGATVPEPASAEWASSEPASAEWASSEPAEPAPAAPVTAPVDEPHASTGPRSSTIVWGFLVVAFGVGLVANAAGAHIDIELAAIVLLAAAGALLVIGSVVSAVRRRRRATTVR